jgi:hypothetical protein
MAKLVLPVTEPDDTLVITFWFSFSIIGTRLASL